MKLTVDQAYSPQVLRRLQMVEYDILKKFDAMCKKHGLEYYALFGSLLGAVRHQGIIPWDDDIDIAMPRRDYEKLMDLIEQEMGEEYTLLDGVTNPRFPYVSGRIMKKGTKFIVYSSRNFPMEQGIFLDIWIVDNIPDDEKARRAYLRDTWIMEKVCLVRTNPLPTLPFKGIKKVAVQAVCVVVSAFLKLVPAKMLQTIRLNITTKYKNENTKLCGVLTGVDFTPYIYERDEIYPLGEMKFEDMMIPTPYNMDSILTKSYGPDYMTPLPEGKRSNIVAYELSFGDEEGHEKINE